MQGLLLPSCVICREQLEISEPVNGLCRTCRAKWPPAHAGVTRLPGLHRVYCLWPYRGSLRRLIVIAKDEPRSPGLLHFFAAMDGMQGDWRNCGPLLSVPASRPRKWHLARELTRKMNAHWDFESAQCAVRLIRRVKRPAQASLSGLQRRRNLNRTMKAKVRWGYHPPTRVCLVDDVLTTGATLRECARALRAAGIKQVNGIVLARAEPQVNVARRFSKDRKPVELE